MQSFNQYFVRFSNFVARASGRPLTFILAVCLIVVWAVTGPLFRYSDAWQLVINTGTTIVTFLMVFLIQNTQNRDGAAIQTKLDELIRASAAQNVYIGIEHLTDEELDELRSKCEARARADYVGDKATRKVREKAAAAAERVAGSVERRRKGRLCGAATACHFRTAAIIDPNALRTVRHAAISASKTSNPARSGHQTCPRSQVANERSRIGLSSPHYLHRRVACDCRGAPRRAVPARL
ncbi:low affinity iron permease family protein [Micromonospora sp. STR1s_5]|nr:low affinity iron permease family protein [Micromonospora sp. STR1s_5]